MKPPPESQALQSVAVRLAELVRAKPRQRKWQLLRDSGSVDAELRFAGQRFLIEWKASGDAAAVGAAVRQLEEARGRRIAGTLLVVAVPFMGPAGQRICAERRVNWLDLSGNAHLDGPGLHVRVEGKPNRFKRRGRPSSPFAPKSARIARWFLMHPRDPISQVDLAAAVDMDKGLVSRVVGRLLEMDLLDREGRGPLRVKDPRLLLDAWAEVYDFEQHHLLRGHVAARAGDELLGRVAEALEGADIKHAATGLAGAWLLTRFAGFRTVTLFVSDLPDPSVLADLGFREDPQGANLWLAIPKDEGVFQGMTVQNDVPCVHPVQAWLDLQGHPERAGEAAEQVARQFLSRSRRG